MIPCTKNTYTYTEYVTSLNQNLYNHGISQQCVVRISDSEIIIPVSPYREQPVNILVMRKFVYKGAVRRG